MIAGGSRVLLGELVGVVTNLGWSRGEDRQIAQVDFGGRRILRVPVEQLKEVDQ